MKEKRPATLWWRRPGRQDKGELGLGGSRRGSGLGGYWKKLLLKCVLEARTAVHRFAESPATLQITQHRFGQHVDGFHICRPFQLLLAAGQVLQRILEPKQIDFTLAHH